MAQITSKPFGHTGAGEPVKLYTLTNASGAYAEILDYGCRVRALFVPDRQGVPGNVVLGHATLEEYEHSGTLFGAIVGRCANRLGHARFTLNGKEYRLCQNEGENHIHGGRRGFDQFVYDSRVEEGALVLRRVSPDGEEHYPGNLDLTVTYSFTDQNELVIDYRAVSDRDTVVNLTNHSYFNLAGGGSALGHVLRMDAGYYTPVDGALLPTGELRPVEGTPFDFRSGKPLGQEIGADDEQLRLGSGYDHNFVIPGEGLRRFAEVRDPQSGRRMMASTTLPGVQLYTANFLTPAAHTMTGEPCAPRCAFCLETQCYPNAMERENFPSPVLRAGEAYHHITVYRFDTV